MDTINTLDHTPNRPNEYRPILRVRETQRPASQETDCSCPELCQLDHDN